jgi:hypothetical protein
MIICEEANSDGSDSNDNFHEGNQYEKRRHALDFVAVE